MVKTNYDRLIGRAINITRNRNLAKDLIADTLIDLTTKGTKTPETNEDFIRYFNRCMTNQYYGKYTEFSKTHRFKEILVEEFNESKEEEQESKVSVLMPKVERFKSTLTGIDLTLFELIYEQRLSYEKIGKLYANTNGVPITIQSIYFLTKELKEKIKELKKNA